MSADETPLHGGRLTPGVVRVGATVRRPASAASGATAALLDHLQAAGFAGAPVYLGQDERGRDMLCWIEGWVPARFQHFADEQVARAGALLRGLHAATRGSVLAGAREVVCHHDPGPNNVVFQDGVPVAFIDFDMAAPGDALEDVAYMAWTWCLSSKPARGPVAVQAGQLRVLADAYGLPAAARPRLVAAIRASQLRNIRFWEARLAVRECATEVDADARAAEIALRIAWSAREMDHLDAHAAIFERALA